MNTTKHVIIPLTHPCKPAWQVARLTELLLMGHSWTQVQNMMAISKPDKMTKMLLASVVVLASLSQAYSESIPKEFQGTWCGYTEMPATRPRPGEKCDYPIIIEANRRITPHEIGSVCELLGGWTEGRRFVGIFSCK